MELRLSCTNSSELATDLFDRRSRGEINNSVLHVDVYFLCRSNDGPFGSNTNISQQTDKQIWYAMTTRYVLDPRYIASSHTALLRCPNKLFRQKQNVVEMTRKNTNFPSIKTIVKSLSE